MTKAERRQRRAQIVDEASVLIIVLLMAVAGSILHASRHHGKFVINPVQIVQAVLIAVGGYAGVQVRFLEEGKKKAPFWKRLYVGLNAALGGDFVASLTNG